MLKKIGLGLLIILALLIIVPYIMIGAKDKSPNDDFRALAPGQFAQLSDGKIHYSWTEPTAENTNGKTVVMLHGLYVPQMMFVNNAEALARAGYRVLLIDHYGHGYSDRPREKYTRAFFDREVSELLDAAGVDQPFILAGQSMGGLIAAQFTAAHPEKVEQLILFVPAGLKLYGTDDNFGAKLLRTPGVGEWLWRVVARKAMMTPPPPPCDVCGKGKLPGDVYEQARYKGYFPAMLSILRHFNLRRQDIYYEKVGQNGTPVLAFFGEQDGTVHIESAKRLETAIPHATIIIMPDGDHALNFRHADKVNAQLLNYLQPKARQN